MTDLSTSMTGDLVDQIIARNEIAAAGNKLASRYKRRPKRKASDKGLGTDEQLAELARTYLVAVAQHFPKAIKTGVVQEVTPDNVAMMVADLKRRHGGEPVDKAELKWIVAQMGMLGLATAYARYSCDNSNPRSIADQVVNCIRKAAEKGYFIPWCTIFVDYALSGTHRRRPGYLSFRSCLSDQPLIRIALIDDFSRASRDMIEWLQIAAFATRYDKPVVGAADNFDTTGMQSKMLVTFLGVFQEVFIESLRQKVGRGMTSAAKRGLCLGKPPLGFTRCALPDGKGGFLQDAEGKPVYEWAPDPETQKHVVLIFTLFVVNRWDCSRIARHLNDNNVDDWSGWTPDGIRKLLKNPAMIGCFIWNKGCSFFDPVTEEWVYRRKPRAEWIVRYEPSKARVPVALWAAARKRIAESRRRNPATGRKCRTSDGNPETLASGYWLCDCCDTLLKLVRSSGRHRQLGNACTGVTKRKCQLKSSKSVRVIEAAFLRALHERLLNQKVIDSLVKQANSELEKLMHQPEQETKTKKQRQAILRTRWKNTMDAIGETSDKKVRQQLTLKMAQINAELAPLDDEIRRLATAGKATLKRLTPQAVREGLRRISEVLEHDKPRAVATLRDLTGPVRVREEAVVGTNRKRWIATFTPRLSGIFGALTGSPVTQKNLSEAIAAPIEFAIDQVPRYEREAEEIKSLIDSGRTISAVASIKKCSQDIVKAALRFARTGERPEFNKPAKNPGSRKGQGTKYKAISSEVVRLREVERLSLGRIADALDVCIATVAKAYDHARPDRLAQSLEKTGRPGRGHTPHLPKATIDRMHELIKAEAPLSAIAQELKCGRSTASRYRKKLQR